MLITKHFSKQLKTKVNFSIIILLLLSITACEKDSYSGADVFLPLSNKGNNLKLTYPNGTTKEAHGDVLIGWYDGQLLGNRYWREIRGGGSGFIFTVRINIPPGTTREEIFGDELDLRRDRLYLENSETITLYPEFWINDNDFNIYNNAFGKLTLLETDSHNIIGELDAEILNNDGVLVKITGFFWSKDANEFTIRY